MELRFDDVLKVYNSIWGTYLMNEHKECLNIEKVPQYETYTPIRGIYPNMRHIPHYGVHASILSVHFDRRVFLEPKLNDFSWK